MAIEDNPVSPETYQYMRRKTKSFVKLVQYLRQQQDLYFKYKKGSDFQNAEKKLQACLALETRIDQECEKMHDLIETHFQPELFR